MNSIAVLSGITLTIEEVQITRSILDAYFQELRSSLELDVAIAGAGPSGLVAAHYLAQAGHKVAVFERKLSVGGGMWGGGMMFNRIVVQEEGREILEEFGVRTKKNEEGLYVADSIESTAALCLGAIRSGAMILNLISVEDVVIRGDAIAGLVINWSPVEMAKLHVDPMVIMARRVIDATGHDCDVCRIVERKVGPRLDTETGGVIGETSMWADRGESALVGNSREVYPNLYVAGMAANAAFGSPRMGPIFGGMLMSGRECARVVADSLGKSD
jgi:thiazole biosynthesis enzyme